MKHFSMTNRIVNFDVKCPADNSTQKALAKAAFIPNNGAQLLTVECHNSYECDTCRACILSMYQMFKEDKEPDFFDAPITPII